MNFNHFCLATSFNNKSIHFYISRLPNPMAPIDSLIFHSGVPPWIKMNDVVRRRQVQTGTASLQADQEDGRTIGSVETVYECLPFPGSSVQVEVG